MIASSLLSFDSRTYLDCSVFSTTIRVLRIAVSASSSCMNHEIECALAEHSVARLQRVVDTLTDEANSIPITEVQQHLDFILDHLSTADAAFSLPACEMMVPRLNKRGPPLYPQGISLRENLADLYEMAKRHRELQNILTTIPREQGLRSDEPLYQLDVLVRLMYSCLASDDIIVAESHLPKALALRKVIERTESTETSINRFLVCHANILEYKRKYIDAAQKYHEVSLRENAKWALEKAIVCALLADVGANKTRVLLALFKDERSASLGELSLVLSKVFHSRILRQSDLTSLHPYLQSHHLSTVATGRSALQMAVEQHNIVAVSHVYFNIRLADLALILGIAVELTEQVVSQMIIDGKLIGTIDQLEGFVHFSVDDLTSMKSHDSRIASTCNSIADVGTEILRRYPPRQQS